MAKKNGNGKSHHLPLYKSYVFKEKDPAIHELLTLVEDHFGRRLDNKIMTAIHESGGPSIGCMHAWWHGDVRRPTNPTLEATGRAIGFRRKWVRMSNSERANAS